jgi:purine-binding chemotaxis protein CheW
MSRVLEAQETLSLCSFTASGRRFGIDTRRVREVVGAVQLQRVPLAPAYIGGVMACRGEVLTAMCLAALLGGDAARPGCPVLVLDGDESEPRFGLLVESVGGVVSVQRSAWSANPSTLDAAGREIFRGAFRTELGLLAQLDPERLRPSHIAACGLFGKRSSSEGEIRCAL